MLYSPSSSINREEGLTVELIDRKGYWRLGDITMLWFFLGGGGEAEVARKGECAGVVWVNTGLARMCQVADGGGGVHCTSQVIQVLCKFRLIRR